MTKSQLRDIIKEIITEELLDEMNSTGGPAGAASGDIQTPYAFKKSDGSADEEESKRMKDIAKHSMPPQRESSLYDENSDNLNEARSRYRNFKESSTYKNSRSKLSYAVLEMKKMMKEVNFLVDVASKLKVEDGISNDKYWKRTSNDLFEIEQFAKSITKKIEGSEMKLKDLIETVIGEQPSSSSVIEFPLAKEMKDTLDAVNNYSIKTVEEFDRTLKEKFNGRTVSVGNNTMKVEDVTVNLLPNMKLNVIFVDGQGREVKYNGKDEISIYNNQEAPTTALTNNSHKQTSANQIKHF